MSKGNSFEGQFLAHIFKNSAIANVGDASGLPASATEGVLNIRLCTSATTCDDATVGTECAYGGYDRVEKGRNGTNWDTTTVAGQVHNETAITFPACTSGSETIRYVEIWKNDTDTTEASGSRLFWGQLTADLAVSAGITPEFAAAALTITED